jgi:trimethylamine--corrinoid protein Co-methyltransferase
MSSLVPYKTSAGVTLPSALSGSNIILMHGALCGEITAHPIMAVLCDDIAGMIGRYIEGVSVNDETIALDLIEKVGPIPGNFLNTTHTRQWWKKEQFLPRVADDLTYPEWMQSGKKDCIDHAKELMEEILATHKVSIPLTQSQLEEIRTILKEARVFYQESGLISDSEWELYADKVLTSRDYRYA